MIELIEIQTAREFIEFMHLYQSHWSKSDEWEHKWIFRGHSNSEWELKPSAHRIQIHEQIKNYLDSSIPLAAKKWKNDEAAGYYKNTLTNWYSKEHCITSSAYTYSERKILQEFCSLANQNGFKIPKAEKFMNIQPDFSNLPFPSQYDGMLIVQAIAQHHGIPTRLLDWTSNPLAASFFACSGIKNLKQNQNLCVWAVKKESIEDYCQKINFNADYDYIMSTEIFEVPRSEIKYLNAQEGLFIGIRGANGFFSIHGKWPDLEKDIFEKEDNFKGKVKKITLPHTEALELYRLLTLSNISHTSLMPSFDSIRKDLTSRWQLKQIKKL